MVATGQLLLDVQMESVDEKCYHCSAEILETWSLPEKEIKETCKYTILRSRKLFTSAVQYSIGTIYLHVNSSTKRIFAKNASGVTLYQTEVGNVESTKIDFKICGVEDVYVKLATGEKQGNPFEIYKLLIKESEDFSKDFYGSYGLVNSKEKKELNFLRVKEVNSTNANKDVWIRGRVQTNHSKGKNCFIILRQGVYTVQVAMFTSEKISKQMWKFVSKISKESIIDVLATIGKVDTPIESCTQKDVELRPLQVFVVSASAPKLPLQIEDASEETYIKRSQLRYLECRKSSQFGVNSINFGVRTLLKTLLDARVSYFKGSAYQAQSPQLYKQMAIAGDFEKVYTIGPVFRAEDSNTHRHMTEFFGLDLEMAFNFHYHEVMETIAQVLTEMFKGLQQKYQDEIAAVGNQYPAEKFQFCEPPLILKYPDAITLLRENGIEIGDEDDLSTPVEKFLGKLVKEKYSTDFYVLDKFPLSVRPFYTMPDANDERYSNSYDMFMRGEEILSGAQRIHDADMLVDRANHHKVDLAKIQSYIDAFKYGCPPHAGGGIALERVTMLFLGLHNKYFT
uniref:Aspartate--tRNA ligase, cytoplasmic n=1 Tax=Caenorhabditis tropicalis TaxID=1561998 RepID=A0A1I7UQP5_9PELO